MREEEEDAGPTCRRSREREREGTGDRGEGGSRKGKRPWADSAGPWGGERERERVVLGFGLALFEELFSFFNTDKRK